MSKHDRLLHILSLLSSGHPQHVDGMAATCGVSERTIYRDMDDLQKANYPIYFDNGYRLMANAELPPPQFTSEEMAVLQAALKAAPLADSPAYGTTVRRVASKLQGWQAISRHPKSPRLAAPVIQPRVSSDPAGDASFYGLISKAISDELSIDIKYDRLSAELTTRRVDPYFLVFRGQSFYLVGLCQRRKEFRMFRMGRIRALTVTDKHFRRDHSVTVDQMFAGSWSVYIGKPFEAVVSFTGRSARVVAQSRHHESEKIEQQGSDKLTYTVRVNSIEEFGRWVLGFGGEARVISPPDLIDWMCVQAQDIIAAYPKSGNSNGAKS